MNLLPLQNCHCLHNAIDMSPLTLVRAGMRSNLLPLQNYHRTHIRAEHESLRTSRSEHCRLYYPFKTTSGPTIPPGTSLCTIFGKNITTSYYPYKTPQTGLLYPHSYVPEYFSLPHSQTKKRASFAFRKISCTLTSVVDTPVGRPSGRPASKSRFMVEDKSARGVGWVYA